MDAVPSSTIDFPYFLQDSAQLSQHFQNEFVGLNSKQIGDRFADFVQRLVPHTEVGSRFESPKKNKDSYDEGIDLIGEGIDTGETLYVQSKYTIPGVDEMDLILSKFETFREKNNSTVQMKLFDPDDPTRSNSYFMIVTMSDLGRILSKYETSNRKTVNYYRKLKTSGRLDIVHGPKILLLLQRIYRRSSLLPSNFQIAMSQPVLRTGNVFIGVMSGSELRKIYETFGVALFFEDPREYLGPTSSKVKTSARRVTVNEAILQTLEHKPEKFLARNNGITFRASQVKVVDTKTLELTSASIVNGCQTTMSIVRFNNAECQVLVKVVEAEDTWDIAMATNFQNNINQIELELARWIRPQAVRAAASKLSFSYMGLSEESSAYAVVDTIYRRQITHDEFKSLFIGLFSNTPRNTFESNYTEIRNDIIGKLFDEGNPDQELVFETLFLLHQNTIEGSRQTELELQGNENLLTLYRRFWKAEKPQYRVFVTILAACGCVNQDIYSSSIEKISYTDMMTFLSKIQSVLYDKSKFFQRYYSLAFTVIALDVLSNESNRDEILRYIHTNIERLSFANLFLRLQTLASTDAILKEYNK